MIRAARLWLLLASGPAGGLAAQPQASMPQTSAGEYTRYELLAPGSGKFRILYEVWATTPGARYYLNPIRKGSVASDEAVYDRASGAPLRFEVVDGAAARTLGLARADTADRFIKVELPRAVPRDGEVRLLIDKTYLDPKSYYEEGGEIVFARSLGIKRNAVVLPAGYELIGCNVPAQVLTGPDGRVLVSFINAGPDAASLVVRGRRLARSPAHSASSAR